MRQQGLGVLSEEASAGVDKIEVSCWRDRPFPHFDPMALTELGLLVSAQVGDNPHPSLL